ncbi:MAG: ferritin-like domain-containing protein [Actinobacteria bacterium]|nr:ferritin-like domain-containing protein [Actinomycetota bacterium]MBV8960873.1 ferritin-like domain-containing protein [Actinomycetota bacterium]MBV9663590.1 ferritin-like domain-containing protein [Actinomycetota bacterium]MBV9935788.1 ferritin-like domain-containing protein [Actinomycetota bacterium]
MKFDLTAYKQRTARLEFADLDFGAFATQPLDADTLRCLRYMHDIEFHTVCYLRDLLLTPAHRDPDVTTFLTFWSFEELWHGEAIAAVLDAHGELSGQPRVLAVRKRLGWRDRVGPISHSLSSAAVGADYIAVHMTWGAVNEWCTQGGYAQLSAKAQHPVLTELLQRIMKQEGRHIDFYSSEAAKRLAASRKAQRITRFALRKFWKPVGSGVVPLAETAFLIDHLFGDDDGLAIAERIDRRVDRLPGLEGLHLCVQAREEMVQVNRRSAAHLVNS